MNNKIEIIIDGKLENVSVVRVAIASFLSKQNITIDELSDIKTAVSEAVTNCIVHGYEGGKGKIYINVNITGNTAEVIVKDNGIGIENIEKAMEPMYTTKPEQERSGMGFSFMEAFMDELEVSSARNKGTTVIMRNKIGESAGK